MPEIDADRSVIATEVEASDLEQKRHERIPRHRDEDPDDVLPERVLGGDLPIIATDGSFIGPFEKASRKLSKGKAAFEGYVLPFEIHTKRRGTIEVTRSMTLFFEDIGGRVQVDTVRIDGEGRIYVDLKEQTACYPKRTWTFRTIDLARYFEAEKLRTEKEIDERARAALDGYPADGEGAQSGDADA